METAQYSSTEVLHEVSFWMKAELVSAGEAASAAEEKAAVLVNLANQEQVFLEKLHEHIDSLEERCSSVENFVELITHVTALSTRQWPEYSKIYGHICY